MAVANYESANGHFPTHTTAHGNLSWRVSLLPFIEEDHRFDGINQGPWDSPANSKFHTPVPHGLQCHNREDATSSSVQVFAITSPDSIWRDTPIDYDDISDNRSDTLVFIELDLADVNWMSPREITLDDLLKMLEQHGRLPTPHPAGVLMSFADVSVRLIPHENITPTLLRSLVSVDGGEDVPIITALEPTSETSAPITK